MIVSGIISDNASNSSGNINICKEGAGTWTLTAPNTYGGTTTISQGTLKLNQCLLQSPLIAGASTTPWPIPVGGSNATIVDVGCE